MGVRRKNIYEKFVVMHKEAINPEVVMKIQHMYGVDYKSVTKRLKEINVIRENKKKELKGRNFLNHFQ